MKFHIIRTKEEICHQPSPFEVRFTLKKIHFYEMMATPIYFLGADELT